jgi:hypothetical protein
MMVKLAPPPAIYLYMMKADLQLLQEGTLNGFLSSASTLTSSPLK